MTQYEKMLSVETITHYAYLLSETMTCERCPAKKDCADTVGVSEKVNCVNTLKQWLESEVENNDG